ncbi:MAG: UDP-3-O-(3-hydroxymyristoyl)glucosamine N-acyltransferase [Desulfobacteraceae bacterium]
MELTVRDIAENINAAVIGDDSKKIRGAASFEDAGRDQITFASDPKFLRILDRTRAGAVVVPENHERSGDSQTSAVILKTRHPKLKFSRILALFHPSKPVEKGISPGAGIGRHFFAGHDAAIGAHVTIGDNVTLGSRVTLMPGVYIGDGSKIGDDTLIKPNVTLMEGTIVGRRVIIHSGTVVGSDGFGFTPDREKHEKIVHAGYVQIDDDVEIGACNTIDRGTFGRTWIKKGVKTDNLVHIAHNVTLGENTLVVAQAGIAGSTSIGDNVILAGRAGVSGHLKIGDGAVVGPGAGVLKNVRPGEIVSGMPSMPHKRWLKVGTIMSRLPELRKRILALEKKIKSFEKS